MMDEKRLLVILSNLLLEIYTKSFDMNYNEFLDYCTLEIGMTHEEIGYLITIGRWVEDDGREDIKNEYFK